MTQWIRSSTRVLVGRTRVNHLVPVPVLIPVHSTNFLIHRNSSSSSNIPSNVHRKRASHSSSSSSSKVFGHRPTQRCSKRVLSKVHSSPGRHQEHPRPASLAHALLRAGRFRSSQVPHRSRALLCSPTALCKAGSALDLLFSRALWPASSLKWRASTSKLVSQAHLLLSLQKLAPLKPGAVHVPITPMLNLRLRLAGTMRPVNLIQHLLPGSRLQLLEWHNKATDSTRPTTMLRSIRCLASATSSLQRRPHTIGP